MQDLDKYITFTSGNYKDNILKIEALCESWHEERKYVKEFKIKYNPDREYFNLLYRTGNLITICIFHNGSIVGAYLGYKSNCMQDKNLSIAQALLWCIKKEYRSSSLLIAFLKYIDETLIELGVDTYSLCLDDSKEHSRLDSYLVSETNPRPFKKIESYYYRDLREV